MNSPDASPDSALPAARGTLDAPLREDVRHLGATVGELLTEQLGEDAFHRVEAIRTQAIARREQGRPLAELAAPLLDLPVDTAESLTRAFSTYFQMVNIAERVHRIRAAPIPARLDAAAARRSARRAAQAQGRRITDCP